MSICAIPLRVMSMTNLQMKLTHSGLRADIKHSQGCDAAITIFQPTFYIK